MTLSDDDIQKVMTDGVTPRMRRLNEARGYIDGTVYEGRPDFFNDEHPLRERRPCVIYPVVRNAVASYAALCLGDGKFPHITSGASENDSAFDDRFGLNESESKTLDAGVRKIVDQTRLAAVAQQVFEAELSCGTSVTVAAVVRGKLRVSQLDPAVCTPTFAPDDPDTVVSLEVRYRYMTEDTWSSTEQRYKRRVFVYRRVIDESLDTTFAPVEIQTPSDNPIPSVPQAAYRHDFGFCPVVWRRANVPIADQQGVDGRPIHWGLYSLIDTVNLSLSQRFRAALYSGDPQTVELGVADDEVQAPLGRAADIRQPGVDPAGWQAPLRERRSGQRNEKRRKRGAGTIWTYESPDADVKMLCLSGDALKAIDDDVKDNVKKLREALGHVYFAPETLTGLGDLSGRTVERIYLGQTTRCDRYREDFGRGWILSVLSMLFRIVLSSGKGLYLAGAAKLGAVLQRFRQKVGDGDGAKVQWFCPELTLSWGDYFKPSDLDEATRIKTVLDALGAERPLITYATAVAAIKSIFPDIQDPNQYLKTLLKEGDDRQKAALKKQQAMLYAMSPDIDDDAPDPTDDRGDAKATPPKTNPRKRPPQAAQKTSAATGAA